MKDQILDLLKNIHEAKELMEINDLLGLTSAEEYKQLQDSIQELVDSYDVFVTKKGKYILLKNCPGIKIGKLSVNKKGFGFVEVENNTDDIYISADNMNGAIHGDTVLVEITSKKNAKDIEGRILKIVKRPTTRYIGEINFRKNNGYVTLDDNKVKIEIEVKKENSGVFHVGRTSQDAVEVRNFGRAVFLEDENGFWTFWL